MKTKKALQQFGLSGKQADVYLAVLELGSSTVAKIAEKAGIPRPTCYDVLTSLIKEGVVSIFLQKRTRHFSAEDPKKIAALAKERAMDIEDVLPQLNAIYGLAKSRPTVRFYQGQEGMKQVFKEMLTDKKDILAFNSADSLFKCLGDYWPKFIQQRIKSRIVVHAILCDSPKARERQFLGPKELRIVKLIPPNFSHHGAIFVFGSKIALFSFIKDHHAVIIESKVLAEAQRSALNYIWKKSNGSDSGV